MTDLRQAAHQALEALESSRIFVITREKTKHPEGTEWYDSAITTLREALAQREWQGLTDEEIWSVVSRIGTADSNVNPLTVLSDARAIEQRLKEMNT